MTSLFLITLCIIQSGIFSGLNLALMGIPRLQLEVEAQAGSTIAKKILKHRQDTHRLLATILWGNVGVNTLLAILTHDALQGLIGFLVSVVLITIVGEILPQAYLNKNLRRVYNYLDPLVYVYSFLLYPLAWPTGKLLDKVVGPDGLTYFRENEIRQMLSYHANDNENEISQVEARGAMNFLKLDDTPVKHEGKLLDPDSIIQVELSENGQIVLPPKIPLTADLTQKIIQVGQPWVILTCPKGSPLLALDADEYIRESVKEQSARLLYHCHRPIIIDDPNTTLGDILPRFAIDKIHGIDDVVDDDVIIYWTKEEKRIVTGADIFGTLLKGICSKNGQPAIPITN